jgi:DNA modification methylase
MIQLIHGDCLEVMKSIPDASVDLVLTDPPYNLTDRTSKMAAFTFGGRAGINFGEWDKDADLFSYIDEVTRVLNKNGSFVVFNDWRNLGAISKYSETKGLETKDLIRLKKSNPMPRNRDRRYITDYECAIWLTKAKAKWVFNRQHEKYQRPEFLHSIESGLHPTQKSLGLMSDLVKIHSIEGQTILDPFMGSGTTGVACKNLKRNFIGIEKDEKYFQISKERIENTLIAELNKEKV